VTLRDDVLRGGRYMAGREAVGAVVGLFGVLVLTRLIGPTDYGLYTAAYQVVTFMSSVARLGTDVYLIRRETDDAIEDAYDQVFSFLVVSGLVVSGVSLVVVAALGRVWHSDAFVPPMRVMLLMLPVALVSAPAQAKLERGLKYRRVALLEMIGQIGFYVVALAMAAVGAGVAAPIGGYLTWQLWTLFGGSALAQYRPRWRWRRDELRDMVRFGAGYAGGRWVWEARTLVAPLAVGAALGPRAVGLVALGVRIGDTLSFVRAAIWRIGLAALSKVQTDTTRLRKALEEAIGYQALATAPFLAGFAVVGPFVVPAVFGREWADVMNVFPYLALGFLAAAVFTPHSSVLSVLRRNAPVLRFNAVYVAVLSASAALFVQWWGVRGYGAAEVTAIATYYLLHRATNAVVPVSYARAMPWITAFAPMMLFDELPVVIRPLLFVPAVAIFAMERTRADLVAVIRSARG
jgi:O-antigen/teichoic acid export membrane protein